MITHNRSGQNDPIAKSWKIGFSADILSREQVVLIHEATLDLLKHTGIRVDHMEAADIYRDYGAEVSYGERYAIVKFPSYLVEDAIRWAARPLIFYGRTPDKDFAAFQNHVGFSTFGECVKIIDPKTREIRDCVKEDLAGITKVCDYMDEIAVVERACGSLDYPSEVQPLHNLEAMMKNTSKAIFIGAVNGVNCRKMIEMACIASGSKDAFRRRPFLNIFVCPTSPLRLGKECAAQIIEAARGGAGIAIIPMALAGATSVVTLAGTVISHNAEVLAAIMLAQMVQKGARCTYCSMSTIMDLKHMISATGSPEQSMISAATVKMAQFYHLPSWIGAGLSDSMLPDAQAGCEFGINALNGALSGANIVYGAGSLEAALTIDYAKLVLDCEGMSYIRKILGGIEVTKETMALDIIHKAGPGGEFLYQKHTFDHMRSHSQVEVFTRSTRSAWTAAGAKDAADMAYDKAARILNTHQVAPLIPGAEEAIAKLIADFERELGLRTSIQEREEE
ncbi:Trimethylamine methyltransferase MttB [Anoxybacterium hadale]|uniref:Trimethylamine methyltransferase MttB n=1 Tax=Anoxybacterium hadale TaxID=3408580 RepID=A0ACD1ACU5_9FIRM|nr:Trimethylamine methyltransferase MttB [Clostridiales bacterium]